MAIETPRRRGRPKKTESEAMETAAAAMKKLKTDDDKPQEKRARKKKSPTEVETESIPKEIVLVASAVPKNTCMEVPVPGPMTAKILEEINLVKDASEDHRSTAVVPGHIPAKNTTSSSSVPQKSFPSNTMSAFSHSTPQHQLAAMSTKAKPPASTTKASPKPPAAAKPPTKPPTKPSKPASSAKGTASSSPTIKSTPAQATKTPSPKLPTSTLSDTPKLETIQPKMTATRLNRIAVDSLTHPVVAGGGNGSQTSTPGQLPPKYKSTARRLTAIMVSLPIFLVTSWVLYERLVQGKEQKHFPRIPAEVANLNLPKWLRGADQGSGDKMESPPDPVVGDDNRPVEQPKPPLEAVAKKRWVGPEG